MRRILPIACIVTLACVLGGVFLSAAWAGDVETQFWLPVQLKVPLTEKVSLKYLAAPLWQEGLSRPSRWALRQGVHYQLAPRWDLGITMDYQPTLRPDSRDEWRLGEQLSYNRTFKQVTWQHRTRLEQRWIENAAFRHRLRLRNRLARPVPRHPNWYGFVEQELHVNVGKQDTGFDQHRLYAGVGKKLSSYCTIEGGYQWIYANTSSPNNEQHLHMAMIQVLLQTPILFKKPKILNEPSAGVPHEEEPVPVMNKDDQPVFASPANDY